MTSASAVARYVAAHAPRMLRELQTFVRFPTVGAQARHAKDMEACASWLGGRLRAAGLPDVALSRHGGPPLVVAKYLPHTDRPTLLIYGHYDVQPAGVAADWERPAFGAQIAGEYLHGRGSSDDKGQLFAHIKAIEACMQMHRALPVNVVCLFDGEEEVGSPHLLPWIEQVAPRLGLHAAVLSDTRMLAPTRPAITQSLRGLLDLELVVSRNGPELHSGHFGGIAPDPIRGLCELTARLFDARGHITIPGFYAGVKEPSLSEREYMRAVGPSDQRLLDAMGEPTGWALTGDRAYSSYERVAVRPSLTMTGISGGHAGQGRKNAVANRAFAHLSLRLVESQSPDAIEAALRRHLTRCCHPGLRVTLRRLSAAPSVQLERHHPILRLAAAAYEIGFGAYPVFLRSGGTIPVAAWLTERLRIPVVLMGFALPDDNMHAVNERMHIPGFLRGIVTSAAFLELLGGDSPTAHERSGSWGEKLVSRRERRYEVRA